MRGFRARVVKLLLLLVTAVVSLTLIFHHLVKEQEKKQHEVHNLEYDAQSKGNRIRQQKRGVREYFNVIPSARNTMDIVQKVPGPVDKGMPGRWLHSQGSMGMVSYKTSKLSMGQYSGDIKEGQVIRVVIEARDSANRPRTFGGDFWTATLTVKKKGSTASRVVDHANGTYSVYFHLGWPGQASVDITLVHPSEAVDYLVNTVWHAYDRIVWLARFEDGSKKSTRSCVLRRAGPWKDKCELTHPYALGKTVLLCDKPGYNLSCDSIVAIYNNNTAIRQRARELSGGVWGHLFKGENYSKKLKAGPLVFNITEATNESKRALQAKIPECEPDQPRPLSDGYWDVSSTWVSLTCRTKQWRKPEDIGSCLRDKSLYLLGDSTSRQWFEILYSMIGEPYVRMNSYEQNNIYRKFDKYNFKMVFKFHPLCLTGNAHPTPFNLFSFEVDVLDTLLDSDCNYVILVSPWAHYPQWTKDMFLERVSLLKEALLRFRARCPDAPIVVKGAHPRDQPGIEGRIFYNNFMLYQLGKILRQTFRDMNAWFLDIWDMNMAHPSSKVVHMPDEVVKQELYMFLSYVCRKISINKEQFHKRVV